MQELRPRNHYLTQFGIALSLLVILVGCGKPVTKSEMAGTYTANYSTAKEKVILFPDGHFTQQVTVMSTSKVFATNGIWTFEESGQRITLLHNFYSVLGYFDKPRTEPEPGTASLPVVRSSGKIQLNDDGAIQYRKQ